MTKHIKLAPCGLNCDECDIYNAQREPEVMRRVLDSFAARGKPLRPEQVKCGGCGGELSNHWSADCGIRSCCFGDRGLDSCGQCSGFGCGKLSELSDRSARYQQAVSRLKRPFPSSYWVTAGMLLAGEYPGAPTDAKALPKLKSLLEAGIRHIIDLTQPADKLNPYSHTLATVAAQTGLTVTVSRFPIRDNDIPSVDLMNSLLDNLDETLSKGTPVYLHCWGGHGRTGTVVGCYLVRHGMRAAEALNRVATLRQVIPDPEHPSPETYAQRQFVLNWR